MCRAFVSGPAVPAADAAVDTATPAGPPAPTDERVPAVRTSAGDFPPRPSW
ncbi:hypothetical protein [Streptomyces ziwulingensis]|uniref:Uncharacterized protein n=1 Tax=Streptomyces ziwulingensis TaxID=1045501 RepID=A0ABP9B3S3_9ACTN